MKLQTQQALLDKCSFSNVLVNWIEEESIEKLMNSKQLTTMVNRDGEIFYFVKLKNIKNGYYFKSGYREMVGNYGNLDTNIVNRGFGNLNGYNVEKYNKHIEDVKKNLMEENGINIDIDVLKMEKIEINKTFQIDGEMPQYERVFNLLMALLPANTKLKTQVVYSNKNKDNIDKNTFYATSKSKSKSKCYTEVKWYNKTEELKENYSIILNENYVRLEFTIYGARKIKDELKTNCFAELTDQKINEWFEKKVKRLITEPVKKWKLEQQKKILKIMKSCKTQEGYKWVGRCLSQIMNEEIEPRKGHKPLLLDVEELIPLVNQIYPNGNKRKRTKKAFRRAAQEDAWNLMKRDDLKLEEILMKITTQTDQAEMVSQKGTIQKVA